MLSLYFASKDVSDIDKSIQYDIREKSSISKMSQLVDI